MCSGVRVGSCQLLPLPLPCPLVLSLLCRGAVAGARWLVLGVLWLVHVWSELPDPSSTVSLLYPSLSIAKYFTITTSQLHTPPQPPTPQRNLLRHASDLPLALARWRLHARSQPPSKPVAWSFAHQIAPRWPFATVPVPSPLRLSAFPLPLIFPIARKIGALTFAAPQQKAQLHPRQQISVALAIALAQQTQELHQESKQKKWLSAPSERKGAPFESTLVEPLC